MTRNRFINRAFCAMALFLVANICLSLPELHAQELNSQQGPPAPTHFTALYNNRDIVLQWYEVAEPNVVEYRIFRVDNGDPDKAVVMIAVEPKNKILSQHRYIDKTAVLGHKYTYFVTAKNSFGATSVNSAYVQVLKGVP